MKRIISLIMSVVMVLTAFQLTMFSSFAKVVGPDKKTELTVTSNQSKYSWGDTIVFNVDVTNVSDETLKGIKINSFARNSLKIVNSDDLPVISRLVPGETVKVQVKFEAKKTSFFTDLIFPIIWIFNPSARNNYENASFNYEKKVKVGAFDYKIGFGIEYNHPVPANIDLTINQDSFTTTEIDSTIAGKIVSEFGIEDLYYVIENDANTNKGSAIIDGENWEADLKLMPGENRVTITAVDIEGGEKSASINITYDMGYTSNPTIDDFTAEGDITYRKGVLLVNFKDEIKDEQAKEIIENANGTVIGQNNFDRSYEVQFDITNYEDLIAKKNTLEQNSYISSVTLDELYEDASISVNDPWNGDVDNTDWNDTDVDGSNWGLEAIDVQTAWEYNDRLAKQPSRIGVVDSGIHHNGDLYQSGDNIRVSLVSQDGYNSLTGSHGTHVTGTIAASPNNSHGVTGIAWNTNLYFASAGVGDGLSSVKIKDGLIRAVTSGAKVVNFSVGLKDPCANTNSAKKEASKNAVETMVSLLNSGFDFLFVQSAGNDEKTDASRNGWFCSIYDGMDISYCTSRYSARDLINRTIIVGSVDNNVTSNGYELSNFSNIGSKVDIVAPGGRIYSTVEPTDGNSFKCGFKSGTSMAAPHVTAVAGLVWSINPEFSMKEVKNIVCSSDTTTKAYDSDNGRSYKMLNAGLAVKKAVTLTDATGTATGRFVDATTGNAVSSGSYKIHKNTAEGEIVQTLSFSNGNFSFELPAGTYVLEIDSPEGYVTRFLTVVIDAGYDTHCGDIALSKTLEQGKLRIVLSWGEYPSDLDSHINGYTKQNNYFHVFYSNEYFSEGGNTVCWLDVDDTSSYGPETITIVDLSEVDNFKYCVHNYTYRGSTSESSGAFSLADSSASVAVYKGDALIATYDVPTNQKGTVWEVFSMDSNGRLSRINRMSYQEDPGYVGNY